MDKKNMLLDRLNLELLQSCFTTNITHLANLTSTPLYSQRLLRGTMEKSLKQSFSLSTVERRLYLLNKNLQNT